MGENAIAFCRRVSAIHFLCAALLMVAHLYMFKFLTLSSIVGKTLTIFGSKVLKIA
jgi:hypothetical protein